MHPATITVLQEQQEARHHNQQPLVVVDADAACVASDGTTNTSSSFPQRLWRFVRESVLARPRRKVRSASYSPESDAHAERPRQSKKRAKSCGHEAEGRANKENCTAFMTANAWRKSKMLQELEASTKCGRTCCMTTTAVLRDKHARDEHNSHAVPDRMSVRKNRSAAAQGRCRNCGQVFFAPTVEPQQQASQFCSLDCKSTLQYLQQVQHFVNERIDEEDFIDSGDEHERGPNIVAARF